MTKTINIAITVPADAEFSVTQSPAAAQPIPAAAAWPYPTALEAAATPFEDRLHAALIAFLKSDSRFTMRSHDAIFIDMAHVVLGASVAQINFAIEAALANGDIEQVRMRGGKIGYRLDTNTPSEI